MSITSETLTGDLTVFDDAYNEEGMHPDNEEGANPSLESSFF
jgi:hypothetical protein